MSGVPPIEIGTGTKKLPLPGEDSDLDTIENALDRFLEKRLPFLAWSPKYRTILLVFCTVASGYCTYTHFGPHAMASMQAAIEHQVIPPVFAHPMPTDTHVPGLDRTNP
jgi:hypothetical protein